MKTKMDIHFRSKNENESHLIISVFFSFTYIQLPSQPYNAPPIPRPVSRFLHVVLVDGIPLSSCTVYRYLCGIFLDDISTREQFAFLVYCYRVKAIFHTVLHWRLCGLTNSPIVKYPFNWGWCARSAEGPLKQWLPNGKLILLSLTKCHGVPCSLPSRITTKVLMNYKTFSLSRPRPRPRPNVQDQDQDFTIQDQDQDFHFCPRGASRPRPWSQGLHHYWNVADSIFYIYINMIMA